MPGLEIDRGWDVVVLVSHEGICTDCADELPVAIFEELGNRNLEVSSGSVDVRVTIFERMSDEEVERVASLLERKLDYCASHHQA